MVSRSERARTSVLVLVVYAKPNIVKVIELRQALSIVRKLVLVLEVERSALGCPLLLAREPLEHALLEGHRRVVFTEPAVDNAADTVPLVELLQQSLFSLLPQINQVRI